MVKECSMRAIAAGMGLGVLLAVASAWTQNPQQPVSSTQPVAVATCPDYAAVYCSHFVTSDRSKDDSYVLSGEESSPRLVFAQRNLVFINKDASKGDHVSDRYYV